MTATNPFETKEASEEYSKVDPVYQISAQKVIEFVNPLDHNGATGVVLDIGAGTGVSSEIILNTGVENLYLVEPSSPMLEQANKRLGDKVSYVQLNAEDLNKVFIGDVDIAYALNTFHLFADMSKFLANIACALKPGGIFVFNISVPTYGFDALNAEERRAIEANREFYSKLNEKIHSEIVTATIELIDKILNFQFDRVYTKEKIEMVFSSVNLNLVDYKEIFITVASNYQRDIWRMIGKSFISDLAVLEELINSIELPKELQIRQAIFKLVNNNQ